MDLMNDSDFGVSSLSGSSFHPVQQGGKRLESNGENSSMWESFAVPYTADPFEPTPMFPTSYNMNHGTTNAGTAAVGHAPTQARFNTDSPLSMMLMSGLDTNNSGSASLGAESFDIKPEAPTNVADNGLSLREVMRYQV